MSIESTPMTVEAFDEWAILPENADKLFEFVAGEIIEVPSNTYVSYIATLLIRFIGKYLDNNDVGWLTTEQGGYMVNGERYAPDVAFISYARAPELTRKGCHPDPPELAVEVISDEASKQEQTALRRKLANYMAAGVVVWVVNPAEQVVEVYRPGQSVAIIDRGGTVSGDDILPGFSLPVKDIFKA